MISMTGRERIVNTIKGIRTDRPAVFFRAEEKLKISLAEKLHLNSPVDVDDYFGGDAVHVPAVYNKIALKEACVENQYYDAYGSLHQVTYYNKYSSDRVIVPILANKDKPDDIMSFSMPGSSWLDILTYRDRLKVASLSGKAVYGGVWATILTLSRNLFGEENLLIAMFENPPLVKALIDKVTEHFLSLNEAVLESCGDLLDVYYFGTDFGTQQSLYIGPNEFNEFFKPNIARIAAQAHKFNIPVMFHTCGAVKKIIPDLIESGVDVLDPVQADAVGMQPESLMEYKNKIIFHGGISTQKVLPFGTPGEVRDETLRFMERLGPGVIIAPDQDMIGDIPLRNIEMLFETARNYQY